MKRTFILITLIITILTAAIPAEAKTAEKNQKTNWQIVKELTKKYHKPIKLVGECETPEKTVDNLIMHRKGKSYILVTKVYSYSDGSDHGWYKTPDGNRYIIGYNKKVPAGKKVLSYVIWNPKTNYEDDVLYVVDNLTYRG